MAPEQKEKAEDIENSLWSELDSSWAGTLSAPVSGGPQIPSCLTLERRLAPTASSLGAIRLLPSAGAASLPRLVLRLPASLIE